VLRGQGFSALYLFKALGDGGQARSVAVGDDHSSSIDRERRTLSSKKDRRKWWRLGS
jgi:hypothetical protein